LGRQIPIPIHGTGSTVVDGKHKSTPVEYDWITFYGCSELLRSDLMRLKQGAVRPFTQAYDSLWLNQINERLEEARSAFAKPLISNGRLRAPFL